MSLPVECSECLFYGQGVCRRNPPVVLVVQVSQQVNNYTIVGDEVRSLWPVVAKDDWCGQGMK